MFFVFSGVIWKSLKSQELLSPGNMVFPGEFSILKFCQKWGIYPPMTWPPGHESCKTTLPFAPQYPSLDLMWSIWSCLISIEFIYVHLIITNISLTYHTSTEAVANRQPNQSQPLDRFLPKEPPLDRPAAPRFPRRGPVSPATLPLTSPRRSPSPTGSAGRPSFND